MQYQGVTYIGMIQITVHLSVLTTHQPIVWMNHKQLWVQLPHFPLGQLTPTAFHGLKSSTNNIFVIDVDWSLMGGFHGK